MKLNDLLAALRSIAPEELAEPWDKVGLQVGDPAQEVRRAILCIDLTEAVAAEAVRKRAQLVVAYHPPIFRPLASLTSTHWKERALRTLVRHDIAVYSPHTALDAAAGGVNDWLAQGISPRGVKVSAIRPHDPTARGNRLYKLVTYLPPAHVDHLRLALCAAGAGSIGAYDLCSFSVEGEGTFRGGPGTHPTIGTPGKLERVTERRLETIVPAEHADAVVAALYRHHPYEEPAFELVSIEHPPRSQSARGQTAPPIPLFGGGGGREGGSADDHGPFVPPPNLPPRGGERQAAVGQGRIVTLARPMPLAALVTRLKRHLGVPVLTGAVPGRVRPVQRIALCAGAGSSLLNDAGEIDAFITGEMRHHDILDAAQRGIAVILAGHTETERPYLPTYATRLRQAAGPGVGWLVSGADQPIGRWA